MSDGTGQTRPRSSAKAHHAEAYVILYSQSPISSRYSIHAKKKAKTEPWVVRRLRIEHSEEDGKPMITGVHPLAYRRYVTEAEALTQIPDGLKGTPAEPGEPLVRWTFM